VAPPYKEEDNHGEDVEHEEEAGADADGEIFPLRESLTAAAALRVFVNFDSFS
jgi:hypothetical protein